MLSDAISFGALYIIMVYMHRESSDYLAKLKEVIHRQPAAVRVGVFSCQYRPKSKALTTKCLMSQDDTIDI